VNVNASQNQEQPEISPVLVVAAQPDVVGAEPAAVAEPEAQVFVLSMQHHIGGGGFADVFRPLDDGRVYKVFRREPQNNLLGEGHGEHEPALRRAVFEAERDAYVIATGVAAISPFVPIYHGTTEVDQVLDAAGADISDRYLLDCCYVVDFVNGAVGDLTQNLVDQHPHLQAVTQAFGANGINHWNDGAVFHPANPAQTKIIDFATMDAYYEGELALIMAE
jgi:hypothetical protein